jgi:hypothetical protein
MTISPGADSPTRDPTGTVDLGEILPRIDRDPDIDKITTGDKMTAAVEQLAQAHPEVASLRRIGTSRLGEPLVCLSVGTGDRAAIVVGMPHPNEPIGAHTATYLARLLCEDAELRESLGFTWHIVPCIDPDGTRLNEGWFKGPFTRTHYARHFYRPAPDDQVEWTFPFAYKTAYFDQVLPETLALMRIIDDVRPAFVCSLHNAESGGVYYYLSRPAPGLYGALHAIPEHLGLPLDKGEPEASYAPLYATAIFGQLSRKEGYDYLEAAGQDPVPYESGESSSYWAGKYGALTLVSELPYWADANADDDTPTGDLYSDALRRQADGIDEAVDAMRTALSDAGDDLTLETPYLRASRAFVDGLASHASLSRWRATQAEYARPATVAERWSCNGVVHMYKTRFAGILLRALEAQVDAGLASPAVRGAHRSLKEKFDRWCAEAEADTPAETLPIRKLVATQLGAILAAARYLDTERPSPDG